MDTETEGTVYYRKIGHNSTNRQMQPRLIKFYMINTVNTTKMQEHKGQKGSKSTMDDQ